MAQKNYKVYFYQTGIGPQSVMLRGAMQQLVTTSPIYPLNLSPQTIASRRFQVRDFQRVGNSQVWKGVFGRLRDDAPNKIDANDNELSLGLNPADRLLEKCHFIYKGDGDILLWQVNTDVGFISRFQSYLGLLLNLKVNLMAITGTNSLNKVLAGTIKSFDLSVARPITPVSNAPVWNQTAFDLMKNVHGASIRIRVSAGRQTLGGQVVNVIKQFQKNPDTKSLRVQIEEEAEPIDLFVERISGRISLQHNGHYPVTADVFSGLDDAFDQHLAVLKPYFR
jgi:hypothetical protein